MANIVRCRRCRTFVYDTASYCHGCELPLGSRKLIGKGAWILIALCTAGYAVARSVDLIQTREAALAEAHRRQAESASLRQLLVSCFTDDGDRWQEEWRKRLRIKDASDFLAKVRDVRDRYSEVFPADGTPVVGSTQMRVVGLSVKNDGEIAVERSVFDLRNAARSSATRIEVEAAAPFASAVAERGDAGGGVDVFVASAPRNAYGYRMVQQNGRWAQVPQSWSETAYEWEFVLTKDDRRFRVFVALHLDGESRLRAFRLGRVEDAATGEIILP